MIERQTGASLRALLLVATAFVLIAGVQLFVLSEQSATFFAWTASSPLTAGFLGAGYFASAVLELLTWRERVWAYTRIAVPSLCVFVCLTLLMTLLDLDCFHFASDNPVTLGATWAWLIIYATIPFALLAALWRQRNLPGTDPPRAQPLPLALRALLALQATVMLGLGIVIWAFPPAAERLWFWRVMEMETRAIAAWLMGLGVAAAHVVCENDARRARDAFVSYGVLALLQWVAWLRYAAGVEWTGAGSGLYIVAWLSVALVSAWGLQAGMSRPPVGPASYYPIGTSAIPRNRSRCARARPSAARRPTRGSETTTKKA
ncbi:MAG TPA: hypothetical protein VFG86_23095 [Chloroflexota bacterium]|nr:hypothetical protein [Chloroflexota bacterium]